MNHDTDNNKPQDTGTPLKELHIVTASSADKSPRRLRPLLSSATLKLPKWVLIPPGDIPEYFSVFLLSCAVRRLTRGNIHKRGNLKTLACNILYRHANRHVSGHDICLISTARGFMIVFTNLRHWILHRTTYIQSTIYHINLRFTAILLPTIYEISKIYSSLALCITERANG
jgi:hypothetical protein